MKKERTPKSSPNDSNNKQSSSPRRPTPDEYRAARLRAGREATRAVRRALLVVALFAGIYYCYLLATQKKETTKTPAETPTSTAVSTNAAPNSFQKSAVSLDFDAGLNEKKPNSAP